MANAPPSYEMSTLNPLAPVDSEDINTASNLLSGGPSHSHDKHMEGTSSFGAAQPTRPAYESQKQAVWHTGQNTTVVVNQAAPLRPRPVHLISEAYPVPTACFNCGEGVVTYLYFESGACTWVSCILIAMTGCDLGCCLLPFCFDYFKDATHKCPKCHMVLGKHKKLC